MPSSAPPIPLDGAKTVVDLLADTAARFPTREALVAGGVRLDYRGYLSAIDSFAARLAAFGVAGERVALLLPNGPAICIATFAAHAARATVVPLNPLYTERELAQILEDAAPLALVYDAARADMIEPLAARLGIAHRLAIDPAAIPAGDAGPRPARPTPADVAFIQYTGGTTGRSKGVILGHRETALNIAQIQAATPIERHAGRAEGERVLCVMPLFHSYALSMGLHIAAVCGATLVALPRYHPAEVLAALQAERITVFPGSPTIYTGLMAHEAFAGTDFSRLHTCHSGSAALPLATLRRWEAATGAVVYEGYGQTEAGPVLTFNPSSGVRKPGSVGPAVALTEVQVVDVETGMRVLPVGERGEIRARGPQIMRGYRNRPLEQAAALRDGWLYTSDIGEFDADGYLYIRDRKKDMVIVGGYNVYPREVEEVLLAHPQVREAAVIGVPDAYRGEALRAYVVAREGEVDAAALLAHCAANLARYKVPAAIEGVEALPKTAVNKIDKVALRARAKGGAG